MKKKLFLFSVMLLCSVAVFAQNTITGSVVDGKGDPVIGAAVMIPGTTTGASTDIDGKFQLSVQKGTKLEVSSIGYKTQEFTVGDSKVYNIVLEDDSELLEGTVVIGYGTVNRKNFTGSVATYDVAKSSVSNLAKTNAMDMLRGLTTGMTLSQSGIASAEPSIQIRGQKSINGGSQPLIILDGVIYNGRINDIDPTTIESMSVMKDATSLASYGSQAANGVIMITSKKGLQGKPTVNFRGSVSLSGQDYKAPLRNGKEWIELANARNHYAPGTTSWLTPLELANYQAGIERDWRDFVQRTGVQQDYSLNVSGATENQNYLFGVSHTNNQNFIQGDEFKRTTITVRLNTKITRNISAGLNLNWANTASDGVRASYGRYFSPYGEPYMPDGVTLRKSLTGGGRQTEDNPLFDTYVGRDNENRGNAITLGGNVEIKFPFLEGLSYKITGNYTLRNSLQRSFQHESNLVLDTDEEYTPEVLAKYLSRANGSINNTKSISWVLDNILTYDRTFGNHYVNATLVYTRDYNSTDGSVTTGEDFSGIGNTTLGFYGLANAGIHKITNINYSLKTDVGYLARVNYSLMNKYHLNASFRRDGSSVFGAKHKWGNFPAVGVAWTISDEPWMKKATAINYLKLKASWGKNGNQSLQPYGTLSRMAMGKTGGVVVYFDQDPVFGQTMSTLGNPYLGWETTTSFNGGWEADFFNRRIHWDVDVYKSKTTDQIFNRTIPVMGAGFTNQSATMGQVNNWGIESSIRADIINTGKFHWDATLNFTMNRNKLVKLYSEDGNEPDDIPNNLFIGQSLGAIYGYERIGIVQTDDTDYMQRVGATPGDVKFKDQNNDGKITPDDRVILGFNKESFRASLAMNVGYGNWNLYMMFNGSFSDNKYGKALNNGAYYSGDMGYTNTPMYEFWTEENRNNTYPRPSGLTADRLWFVDDYGFVRLQDVNLSYNVSGAWLQRIHIASAQLYVSGTNLFFIAPGWHFSDPEVRNIQSQQLRRSITFGVNVRF